MDKITLYGAGGHCQAVIALIHSLGQYKPNLILDDNPVEDSLLAIKVKNSVLVKDENETAFITIGDNNNRKKISEKIIKIFPSFVHASVVKYDTLIGKGTVILPGAILDEGVLIGDFCIVNLNATLAHNVKIGDFCHVAINAAITGGVELGEGAFIAASSVILPNIKIGKWATVGAGAVVTKDVPDNAVVFGNPARIIKYNNERK